MWTQDKRKDDKSREQSSTGPVSAAREPGLQSVILLTANTLVWNHDRKERIVQKAGLALGGWAVGMLLAYFGYVANVEQSSESAHGILLMFSIIPGVLTILSGVALFWYNLDDDEVEKIALELEKRRREA